MAGNPQFRFTIFNTDLYPDGIVVNIPVGWKDAKISLERHEEFHSLIEYFAGDFIWYGKAREVLTEIENDQGIDARVRLLVEIRYRNTWEELFNGQIDLSQLEDYAKANTFYKTKAPIIRDDFWAKFINRMKTPVDLEASGDLDGNARTPILKTVLPLPSQVIRQKLHHVFTELSGYPGLDGVSVGSFDGTDDTNEYLQFDWDSLIIDEVEEKFRLPVGSNPAKPVSVFDAKFAGEYIFDVKIVCSDYAITVEGIDEYLEIYFQRNNETPIAFTKTPLVTVETAGPTFDNVVVQYSFLDTIDLLEGDSVRIYGVRSNDRSLLIIYDGTHTAFGTEYTAESYIKITADTIYQDTTTDAYLIKDAAESIVSKLVGVDNVIQSSFFETNSRLIALMKGKHVRGYSFTEKEFFLSFEEWWNGANPLLNLGLGYVDGENLIEIESKAAFYDNDFTVTFDNVPDMVRSYDLEKFFKIFGTGFKKWSAESESGIDDPQTKGKRRSRFSNFGQDETIESDYYMASLGIEQTRRNRAELGKDWKLDEDTMAIGLKEDGDDYLPEVGADFEGTTGLLNPDERINIRYTPRTMFERWKNYVMGGLQKYLTDSWIFTSGEGNYSMSNEYPVSDWEFPGLTLTENENVPVTQDYLWIPEIYKARVPMSWEKYKAIKANRKKAIGISATTSGHRPYHILNLDFQMMSGSAEITVILGNELTVSS